MTANLTATATFKKSTTTALAASTTTPKYGDSVSFSATVTVTGSSPSGSVTFYDGAAPIGTAALVNGHASFSTAGLAVGSHNITASYSGDGNNAASSAAVSIKVAPSQPLHVEVQQGKGAIASSPAGVACGNICDARFLNGATVSLTATADQGYTFMGWLGACKGKTKTCTLKMTKPLTVQAKFLKTAPKDWSPGTGAVR